MKVNIRTKIDKKQVDPGKKTGIRMSCYTWKTESQRNGLLTH